MPVKLAPSSSLRRLASSSNIATQAQKQRPLQTRTWSTHRLSQAGATRSHQIQPLTGAGAARRKLRLSHQLHRRSAPVSEISSQTFRLSLSSPSTPLSCTLHSHRPFSTSVRLRCPKQDSRGLEDPQTDSAQQGDENQASTMPSCEYISQCCSSALINILP